MVDLDTQDLNVIKGLMHYCAENLDSNYDAQIVVADSNDNVLGIIRRDPNAMYVFRPKGS